MPPPFSSILSVYVPVCPFTFLSLSRSALPRSCFLLACRVGTSFVARTQRAAVNLTATSNVLFQSSPQSLHLGSQLFSNLTQHRVLRLEFSHLLIKLSDSLHLPHPAFCGSYPVSLPLPLKLVPINVVVPGKGRWATIVKGAVAGHFIIFGLMFQTAHGK